MDEQEEKNQSESFTKQQVAKGKDKLKDEAKKQAKKKIMQFLIANPYVLAVIAGVIIVPIILVVFFGGALYVVDKWKTSEIVDSKQNAMEISYSKDSSTTITDENGNIINKVIVKPNNNNNGYEIDYNDDSKNLEKVRDEFERQTSISGSKFSEFELAVFGALMDNGADLSYYTEEQLHCFPTFIKAESATQYLDLRKNSEKLDRSGNYQPEKLEKLDENEVPGVILVQRTNTNQDSPNILEYMQKEEFDKLVNSNDIKVINYFTISDEGNLLIAKWDHVKITVDNPKNYPENISESEKENPKDENIITTEEINYSQYIKKYTMPFEFLVQLLIITEEPEFCKEIADIVLESKIVINIQEEETVTVTTEVKDYTVHTKDEKRIDYLISPQIEIESNSNYLLGNAKDDEGNNCTTYNKKESQVTVVTTYTSHSYVFEISEADTWLAHYVKKYQKQPQKSEPESKTKAETKGNYSDNAPKVTTLQEQTEILKDKNASNFKKEKENYYGSKIIVPEVSISNTMTELSTGKKYRKILFTPENIIEGINGIIVDEGTDFPDSISVITKSTNEVPSIDFKYDLDKGKYKLTTDKAKLVECVINKLEVKEFYKMDVVNNITTNATKYPSDPNPKTTTHIYATKDGNPGSGHGDIDTEYEKILLAYDNNKNARNQINSIDSWLFEMMEENKNTVELVDTFKYLLYMYDGHNRGVTELEGFEELFNPDEFATYSSNNSYDAIKNFIHHFEGTPKYNSDKTKYIVFDDGVGNAAVGWGIDIKNGRIH